MRLREFSYKIDYKALNDILNEWDFLNIVSDGVKNEYEDIINPILKLLYVGSTSEAISESISREVSKRYGFKVKTSDKDVIGVSEKILIWWNSKDKQ